MDNRGCQLLYLPAYSPDFNPIELAFSKIKAYVKRNGAVAREERNVNNTDVVLYLLRAAFSVKAENVRGWFHHCGYI
jgi:transposase